MADDPNLRHEDGWFVSGQPHEYRYFKTAIQHDFPYKTEDQIVQAILICRKSIEPSEGRKKLTECVRRRLSI